MCLTCACHYTPTWSPLPPLPLCQAPASRPLDPGRHQTLSYSETFVVCSLCQECSSHTGHGWGQLIFRSQMNYFPFRESVSGSLAKSSSSPHCTHPSKLFPLRVQRCLLSSNFIIHNYIFIFCCLLLLSFLLHV